MNKKIMEAMEYMDEKYIGEALDARKKASSRKTLMRWRSIAACLVLVVGLCVGMLGGVPAQPQGSEPQLNHPQPSEPAKEIVLPPTRYGEVQAQSSLYRGFTLEEGVEEADVVAWIRIGNWLGEDTDSLLTKTYFRAEVVECYKGNIPNNFVLKQYGSSAETTLGFPLFTYGNELLLFLNLSETDFTYGSCYYLIGDYATVIDIIKDENGVTYASDRIGYMTQDLSISTKNHSGDHALKSQLHTTAAEFDAIQGVMVNSSDYLFELSDIVDIIIG